MTALAARREPVRGMAPETLARLTAQARLQAARDAGAKPAFDLRPAAPGKGFDLLPASDPGDLFYDIEGDPHFEGGLEYLHGLWAPDAGFRAIWAHDRVAERAALVAVLEAFRARLAAHPGARIYHYAAYEVTSLRRLTALHGIGEAFLDRLLRERRFVDLYAVVRGGLLASEPDYSIKSLEVFTGVARAGEVKTAGGSEVAYERWLEERDDAIPRSRTTTASTASRPRSCATGSSRSGPRGRGRCSRRRGATTRRKTMPRRRRSGWSSRPPTSIRSGGGSSSTSASSTGARRSPPGGRSSTASGGTRTS
jgi:predicted RecB family nuclease